MYPICSSLDWIHFVMSQPLYEECFLRSGQVQEEEKYHCSCGTEYKIVQEDQFRGIMNLLLCKIWIQ